MAMVQFWLVSALDFCVSNSNILPAAMNLCVYNAGSTTEHRTQRVHIFSNVIHAVVFINIARRLYGVNISFKKRHIHNNTFYSKFQASCNHIGKQCLNEP